MIEDTLKFRVSSALKNIIGKELITDDFIAIFELVKNAYDANSKKVEIVFSDVKDEKKRANSRILIRDEGDGMSFDDLKNKWLLVGFSEKKKIEELLKEKDYRQKLGEKRIFAGAKGIGRFSCDRLGKKLKLLTKQVDNPEINVLDIDWTRFEQDSNAEFQDIKVAHTKLKSVDKYISPKTLKKGTILEITCLNSVWDYKKLVGLKQHLQRLINPSQMGSKQDFVIYIEAREFLDEDTKNVEKHPDLEPVNGPVKNFVFEKLGIQTTRISSSIDDNGETITTELFDKENFVFRLKEKNDYTQLKDIVIKLFYLNKPAKITFTRVMGIPAVRYGSIFLYKNGFRISPYGNEGDDWLGLERRKGQGVRRYLSTRDLIGRIELNGYQPFFIEVSSRDGGVVKNSQYDELTKNFFMEKVLRRLERFVVEGLAWDNPNASKGPKDPESIKSDSIMIIDQIVGQVKDENKELEFNKDLLKIVAEKQIEKAPELIKSIQSLKKYAKTEEEKEEIDQEIKLVSGLFRNFQLQNEELQAELKQREKQVLFLQKVTDKDTTEIIGLQHHINNATNIINTYLKRLKDLAESSKTVPSDIVLNTLQKISMQTLTISSVALFVTQANFDVIAAKTKQDLVEFIKQYIENAYVTFNKKRLDYEGIQISVNVDAWAQFVLRFNPLDFIMIFDNLISNSRKAKAHNIDLNIIKKNEEELEIRVKDDGIGIPPQNIEKLFSFGFSTTEGGTGIGLYQVKKIIDKYGGINVNNGLAKGSEFIITVRRSH
jgi:signal transduction histidine kinase